MNFEQARQIKPSWFFAAKLPRILLGPYRFLRYGTLGQPLTKKLLNWYTLFLEGNKKHTNKELVLKATMNYKNKKVYIGIDVHKKTYTFTAICNGVIVKKATVPADPEKFVISLKKWFSGGRLHSVYEAGFSGFKLHRYLCKNGINNIVINPASLQIAANDKVKTDSRDSKKLAEQLFDGRLQGIYIPEVKEELRRQITRTREQIIKERSRVSHQLKSRLHYFGLISPDDSRVMSEKYLKDLESKELPEELSFSLKMLSCRWRFLSNQINEIRIEMAGQAFEDAETEAIYRSVPGIGEIWARTLSNELGDLSKRFHSQKAIYQYTGFTPSEYSSGESVHKESLCSTCSNN